MSRRYYYSNMRSFYVLNEEQRDLYFDVICELPDEVYSMSDKDVEILNKAIDIGSTIEPHVLKRLIHASVFERLLKEIKVWHNCDKYESADLMPFEQKKKELLDSIHFMLNK